MIRRRDPPAPFVYAPKEWRCECPTASAVSGSFTKPISLAAQKRGAVLLAAFLFPGGGATYAAPWLLGLGIAGRITRLPQPRSAASFRIPVLAFVGWLFVSALYSPLPVVAFESWALAAVAFGIVLPTITAALDGEHLLVRRMHAACAVGTFGAAAYGLLFLRAEHLDRAQLPGLGPNALGFGLAAGMLLTLPLLKARLLWAAGAAGVLTVALAGVIATFSRAALYAMIAGGVVFLCLEGRRLSWRLVALAGLMAAIGIAVLLARPGVQSLFAEHLHLSGRVGERTELRGTVRFLTNPAENSDRVPIWRAAAVMIQRRPWVGLGLGVFPFVVHDSAPDIPPGTPPHNLFIDIAVEGGLPALGAFVAIIATAVVRGAHDRDSWRNAQLAALAGMLAAEIRDNVLMGFHMSIGFMLVLAALAATERRSAAAEETAAPAIPPACTEGR